jgi:hypothetical protein
VSKITIPIPEQNYELIGHRIAEILTDELDMQAILNYEPNLEVSVWRERTKAFASTELPAININFPIGNYGNDHQGSSDGTYTFFVDCHTQSKDDENETGDIRANKKVQRLMGVCRYILKDPIYKTLGFAPGFVQRVSVQSITIAQPDQGDEMNGAMARLVFIVQANERNTLLNPPLIAGYETTVKMNESDEGYFYEGGTE